MRPAFPKKDLTPKKTGMLTSPYEGTAIRMSIVYAMNPVKIARIIIRRDFLREKMNSLTECDTFSKPMKAHGDRAPIARIWSAGFFCMEKAFIKVSVMESILLREKKQ